jgi:hypothetical protein
MKPRVRAEVLVASDRWDFVGTINEVGRPLPKNHKWVA